MAARLGLAAAALCIAGVVADEAVVNTPLGPLRGLVYPTHRLFQGVKYAHVQRWAPPAPVASWAPTVLNATVEGPGCPQLCTNDEPPHICPPPSMQSEECLFMNVYTPRAAALQQSGPVPVLVFIHGGNFHDGYTGGTDLSGGLLYDGSAFVNDTGFISVVINYRCEGRRGSAVGSRRPLHRLAHRLCACAAWARSGSSTSAVTAA